MGILRRLKTIWALSEKEDGLVITHPSQLEQSEKQVGKRLATIVEDDPLDIFNENDNVETSERPSTD